MVFSFRLSDLTINISPNTSSRRSNQSSNDSSNNNSIPTSCSDGGSGGRSSTSRSSLSLSVLKQLTLKYLIIVYSTTTHGMAFMHMGLQYIYTEKPLQYILIENMVFMHPILLKLSFIFHLIIIQYTITWKH